MNSNQTLNGVHFLFGDNDRKTHIQHSINFKFIFGIGNLSSFEKVLWTLNRLCILFHESIILYLIKAKGDD